MTERDKEANPRAGGRLLRLRRGRGSKCNTTCESVATVDAVRGTCHPSLTSAVPLPSILGNWPVRGSGRFTCAVGGDFERISFSSTRGTTGSITWCRDGGDVDEI